MTAAPGSDGRIHPNWVRGELQSKLDPNAILIADGGDFLSFARVGLSASAYLDPGSLGCIGVGTPFGVAASLAFPDRQVVVATGDGAFGFNAMARAFGMYAERVERSEDLAGAIERALKNRSALLDVVVTPEAKSSDGKTGLAWVPDLQALAAWDLAEREWRQGQMHR